MYIDVNFAIYIVICALSLLFEDNCVIRIDVHNPRRQYGEKEHDLIDIRVM